MGVIAWVAENKRSLVRSPKLERRCIDEDEKGTSGPHVRADSAENLRGDR